MPAEPLSVQERREFEKWWMEWAFKNSRPQAKRNYTLGEAIRAAFQAGLAAHSESGVQWRWKCRAQFNCDPPTDCDFPFCGCDPGAEKVISALMECGWKTPEEAQALVAAAYQAAAHAMCDCCRIDGPPKDTINQEGEGPRFVHVYGDGEEIECSAQEIHALIAKQRSAQAALDKIVADAVAGYVKERDQLERIIKKQGLEAERFTQEKADAVRAANEQSRTLAEALEQICPNCGYDLTSIQHGGTLKP